MADEKEIKTLEPEELPPLPEEIAESELVEPEEAVVANE